ncbi:MAG: family 20 glycosylhydrolase, partial [Lachnospiraceae bacterium]|nr:family 20 glycosylhydrolase [Lachnospiraceae bacterium]
MKLIPCVKYLESEEGFLKKKEIFFDETGMDSRLATALRRLPCTPGGVMVRICIDGGLGSVIDGMPMDPSKVTEGYALRVCEDCISICAATAVGAFYAIQTLRQLFMEEKVPCLYIRDWPDFSYRGFYHDVTRGRIQTVETIKKLIDDMAYYKLNSLQLYVEHVFAF